MFTKTELKKIFNEGYIVDQKFGPKLTKYFPISNIRNELDIVVWKRVSELLWSIYDLDIVRRAKFIKNIENLNVQERLLEIANEIIKSSNERKLESKDFYKYKYVDNRLNDILRSKLLSFKQIIKTVTKKYEEREIYKIKEETIFKSYIDNLFLEKLANCSNKLAISEIGIEYVGRQGNEMFEENKKLFDQFKSAFTNQIYSLINKDISFIRDIHKTLINIIRIYYNLYNLSPNLAKKFKDWNDLSEEGLIDIFKKYSQEEDVL